MSNGGEGSGDQPPEMQLVGRLALSAAALLLLTLAYKYYRSRVSASTVGGDGVRTEAGREAGQRDQLACDGPGRGAEGQELRHRHILGKGVKENGGPANPNMHLSRPAVVVESRLNCTPVGREVTFLNGKEEEEEKEGKQRKEMSHLGTRLQQDKKQSLPEKEEVAEKEEETAGTVLSYASGAGTAEGLAATQPGGRPTSLGLLSQGWDISSLDSDHKGPGPKADFCPDPRNEQAGRAPPPTNGNGSLLDKDKGQVLGGDMNQNLAQVQEVQVGREAIQSFRATSDMGLAINQCNGRSSTAYTFSSVAKVQVEENVVKERQPKEGSCTAPSLSGSSLRGKVYDYYVQSISRSVSDERPSLKTEVTQTFYSPPTSEPPNDPEARLPQGAAQNSATEDEEKRSTLKEGPAPSPAALFPQDNANAKVQHVDPEETDKEASGCQKPPGKGQGFSRKESFHQIAENPELQVQMEGFGSPASRKPGCSAPDIRPICSPSVSSLAGSRQSLQADATVEPTVALVAGARFFHIPLNSESSVDIHLDLGNCYEVLCTAKKQKLERLQEAAYKVMSKNYLQVLRTHAIYGRLNALERDLILQRRMRGKKCVAVADVSSQDHSHGASRLCYYDDQSDTWHPLTHVPMEAVSRGCAVCSMFNYLFVVAGCEGRGKTQKPSNRVFCYNPLTDIWRELCPLNQARPHCKLVALDGCLYAIGGECLYTVERYDPRMDRWTFAAPLPNDTFAVAHTATVCDGEIYVTGGTLRYMLLRYISRSDTWKVSLTGGSKDRTTEMVTINGFIYRFDLNRSMGISVYRCSAKAKLWYECATNPLPFPACFQCAVVDNLVYCISRQFNIRFLADYVSPRFGTKELQNFPSPRGTLFPVTLVLPDRGAAQTRV